MSATNGYANGHDATNGNGNGEHKKAFVLAPPPEDLSNIAPQLRHQARCSSMIGDAAKVLFDHLTDQSFLRSVSPARGVVRMSKAKLAGPEHLNCSVTKIQRSCRALEAARFIWTEKRWEGGFEITYWYIRGMADPQSEFWNGGVNPSFGSRRSNRSNRPAPPRDNYGHFCRYGAAGSKSAETPINTGGDGQNRPEATDKNDRSPRSEVTVVHGQIRPEATVRNDRSPRSEVTGDAGQIRPETPVKSDREARSEVTELRSLETVNGVSGESSKRLFNRAGAAAEVKKVQRHDENEFMELCMIVFGKKEMIEAREGKGNGGLWRQLFRQNPEKAWRVLNETRTIKKERPETVRTTYAQVAMDLWQNRFA